MVGAYAAAVDVVINGYPFCQVVRAAVPALDPLGSPFTAYLFGLALLCLLRGLGYALICRRCVSICWLLRSVVAVME